VILIFSDDGGLTIADDLAGVRRQCEGIDVLSDVFRFYDENGTALKPVFDVPVRQRRILWFVWLVDQGTFHLEIDSTEGENPLWVALCETSYLEPNKRFESVEELKSFLRSRGVVVDRPG
jgi:hypothetical protein